MKLFGVPPKIIMKPLLKLPIKSVSIFSTHSILQKLKIGQQIMEEFRTKLTLNG